MSRTNKDKKGMKWKFRMNNNGPSNFKREERAKRRAQAKSCMQKGVEPDRVYIYSNWYW